MDEEQAARWAAAQREVEVGVDLVPAARQQLEFLAAVDRRLWLYEGPLLDRAMRRYKACWLPLLAKHTEAAVVEGPLVVPLDCEWIWHCHGLNPDMESKGEYSVQPLQTAISLEGEMWRRSTELEVVLQEFKTAADGSMYQTVRDQGVADCLDSSCLTQWIFMVKTQKNSFDQLVHCLDSCCLCNGSLDF